MTDLKAIRERHKNLSYHPSMQGTDYEEIAHLLALLDEARETLKFCRPLIEKWCHYQGDTEELFAEYMAPIYATLAKLEGK